jgi:hypothetical protein
MSLEKFITFTETTKALQIAKKQGLERIDTGKFGRNGVITHIATDDGSNIQKLDKPIKKGEEPSAKPAKKSTDTKGKSTPGKLSDKDDNLSDGEIKQTALDLGIKPQKGWRPAPGNAASAMAEIMSGEAFHLLDLKPKATDEELAAAIYNQVKDTQLGKENMGKDFYKNKFEGRNQKLWQLSTSIAKSGKKKYRQFNAGLDRLENKGILTPPVKTRNFYGHEVSLQKQTELVQNAKGPFYTDQEVEIPKEVLLDLISQSGGGANPSDTATLAIDSKGVVMATFHSDKVSTADIQANTTINQAFNDQLKLLSETTLSDKTKIKAQAIIEKGQQEFEDAEQALKKVGQKEAIDMSEKDMAEVLDAIKNDKPIGLMSADPKNPNKSKDKTSTKMKFLTKQRSKKAGGGSIFQDYIDTDNPTEEDLLKGFYKYMGDPNREFEPTGDMVTLFQRSAAQQDINIKSQISIVRERSIIIQRNTHAELNKTKVKLKSGATKGLGDYVEGKRFVDAMHINIVDGEKGKGIGKYPGAFKLNMGGVVVEGKQIGDALGIDSSDDFITHLEVGTPDEGEEYTYADKERTQITGRNIFVYAITKDGKRLPVGYKTQRSKQGPTGRMNETFQWSTEVQKKFKSMNIDEYNTISSMSESASFKDASDNLEERELKELFASIPFPIDTIAWSQKHKGQKPKGNGTWKFGFKVPVRTPAASYLDDGEFTFKGMFKKAVQSLVKYLKRSAGPKGNIKQAKVTLEP